MNISRVCREGTRFFSASLLATSFDLLLASLVLWTTGSPYLGCFLGSQCGMVLLYYIHVRWTFVQTTGGQLSWNQFLKFAVGSWLILGLRLAFLALCALVFPPRVLYQNLELIAACGLSFCVNFLMSRFMIFRQKKG